MSKSFNYILQGGYTSHLDLDHGALAALESTTGESGDDDGDYSSAFSDAAPRLPQILAAQVNGRARRATQLQQGRDEMLSDEPRHERQQEEAREGLHTQDYNYLTDAAGTL